MSRVWLLFLVALPLGCERSELPGRVGGGIAQGGTSGDGGSGEEGGVFDPVGPLVDPTARDTDPTFTADLKELYFMSHAPDELEGHLEVDEERSCISDVLVRPRNLVRDLRSDDFSRAVTDRSDYAQQA